MALKIHILPGRMRVAVIAFSSAKGGVGKTSLSVNLAAELALQGVATTVLDCDINQHATRFGSVWGPRNPEIPLRFIGGIDTSNVLARIREAEAESDVVVIDLPAGTSELSLRALTKSQLVIIPAQRTVFDVRDATKTALQVADAQDVANVRIGSVLVWSRVQARMETRTERAVRQMFLDMIDDPDHAVLKAPLHEYDAYAAGFVYGWVPRQVAHMAGQVPMGEGGQPAGDPIPRSAAKASENMAALTGEIYQLLADIADGKPPVQVRLKPDYQEMLRSLEEQVQ